MFTDLKDSNDAIENVFARLAADAHPQKIDLGIGVLRDAQGQVPVMQAVRDAEKSLLEKGLSKSYLSPYGNQRYCELVEQLVFGEQHPILNSGRVVSAQTPGAGGGLRVGAEVMRALHPDATVWASDPVWAHQVDFFKSAGFAIRYYRYYDRMTSQSNFVGMCEDLQQMKPNDVLLLHGCCHNPSGHDLSPEQWTELVAIVSETGAVPFVDIAYQGFADGLHEDTFGLRLLADEVPELILAVSSSKSFGIYRERAGLLSFITAPKKNNEQFRRFVGDTIRTLYFMPPDHGAQIVCEILSDEKLRDRWKTELEAIRQKILSMRTELKAGLEDACPGFDADFIIAQKGMFSCLPVTAAEQQRIEQQFHIYMLPDARMNVAAMNHEQLQVLADAFQVVRLERADNAVMPPPSDAFLA